MHARKHKSQNLGITLYSSALEKAIDKFDTVLKLLQEGDEESTIKKIKYVHTCKHKSQDLACTLCSSALEQAIDKFDTVLELLQIGDEYPTIKI